MKESHSVGRCECFMDSGVHRRPSVREYSKNYQKDDLQGTMSGTNFSSPAGFILLGFSDQPQLEAALLVVISVIYIVTLTGNTMIILVSFLNPKLHTPMYFFLSNLSFLDLCFTTSIVPQMLWNLKGPEKTISYAGCVVQLFISLGLGSTECILLTVMAYDRFNAICRPLRYGVIMHAKLLRQLAALAWISGFGDSTVQTSLVFQLPLCSHHRIDDFMCEEPAMIKIACGDTTFLENELSVASVLYVVIPLGLILISYAYILRSVLRMKSTEGRRKAFSTCGSHLTVLLLFFGTIVSVYIQPKSKYTQNHTKFLTLFYTVVTPSLNPLIYTLRNKDIKWAIKRLLTRDTN
ncbi:olfactory receptor 2G3-like isoform X2 [Nannospalax galili]|nr:olfactory receptor 2G3-like isoform X2 [Nannospalax galili]XP_029423420.1 olfactory receptor 2G3-like isoform X2 [Nannospalax galili]XP_029423421.1 olfactory receptor 2G3-like isoform X2 [Nannospalax galili]XP_029423422.1 olfactory receptor 2G3-like isoform X2 [Nannospalax galili]